MAAILTLAGPWSGACSSKPGGAPVDGAAADSKGEACQDVGGVNVGGATAQDHSSLGEKYLFDPGAMHHFEIVVAAADLARMDADPRAEAYVPATVRFEGFEYRSAAVRYKGGFNTLEDCFDSAGRLDKTKCRKFSLKVSFNEYQSCGRFFGVRKLVLNSMSRDPTLLHERVSAVFRQRAEVHTPRISYATASINGVDRGVFALVEEVDKEFLDETYADATGDLYKAVWPRYSEMQPYQDALVTNKGSSDGASMMALYRAVNGASAANFTERTAGLLDAARVARRLAVGYIVADNDGPAMTYCFSGAAGTSCENGNYYWYNEPGRGFDLITWDSDADFWNLPRALDPSLFTQEPSNCGPMLICQYLNTYFVEDKTCAPDGATMLPPACDPLMRLSVATNLGAYQAAINGVAMAYADGTILGTVDTARAQLETVIAAEAAWGVDAAVWRETAKNFRGMIVALGQKVAAAAR